MPDKSTHKYPLPRTLAMAQRVVNILSALSEEDLKKWAEKHSDSIDATIDECGYQLLTHPEFANALYTQKKKANTLFQTQLELIGKYAAPSLLGEYIKEFSLQGNIEFLTLLIESLSDEGKMSVGPQILGDVIRSIFYEAQFGSEARQEAAVVAMRKIMTNLASHPQADITHLVDPYMLSITLVDASSFGQLEFVRTMLDNLSNDALVIIGSLKLSQAIEGIYHAPSYNTKVTCIESTVLIREFMERLANHPYMLIPNLIDVSKLKDVINSAFANNNIGVVSAITETLRSQKADNDKHVGSRYNATKLKAVNTEDISTMKVFLMRERTPHRSYGFASNL